MSGCLCDCTGILALVRVSKSLSNGAKQMLPTPSTTWQFNLFTSLSMSDIDGQLATAIECDVSESGSESGSTYNMLYK